MPMLEEKAEAGALIVSSIGPDGLKIAGHIHSGPLLLWPSGVVPVAITNEDDFTLDRLPALFQLDSPPELLLVGCGPKSWLPRPVLKNPFKEAGIAVEFMDTFAAARTYNLMVIDGRTVAALLLPVR